MECLAPFLHAKVNITFVNLFQDKTNASFTRSRVFRERKTPSFLAKACTYHKSLFDNMGDTGLEPVTPCLSSKYRVFSTIFSSA